MEFKTTKRDVMQWNDNVIKTGYCEMQKMLSCFNRTCYTSGTYGWNADIYNIDGMCFCTGYRPFGNIRPDYDLVEEYENKAEEINSNYQLSYDERKNACLALLHEFYAKCLR